MLNKLAFSPDMSGVSQFTEYTKACGLATQMFEQNIDSAIEAAAYDARESLPRPHFSLVSMLIEPLSLLCLPLRFFFLYLRVSFFSDSLFLSRSD